MKHMNRVLSIILCAAMLMSCIVCVASAEAKLVKNVHLFADVPYAGRVADFTARAAADAIEQGYMLYFRYQDGDGIYHSVSWYDKTADKLLKPGDRFVKGHEYTQNVAICTEYGYEFPYQRYVQNGVTNWYSDFDEITLNGESVTAYNFDLSSYRNRLYVSRTYPPCTDAPTETVIDEVAVKNLDYPMAGNTPDHTVTTVGDFYGLHNDRAYDINWYIVKGDYLITMDDDDVFTVGTTYRVDITLKANYGYRFKYDNPDTPNMKSATVNGLMASCVNRYYYERPVPERELKISYTFPPCPGDVVSQIEITGVAEPVAGEKPSYAAVMLTDACDFSGYEDSKNKNGINWYDETAGDFLRTSDTFIAGHEYTVSFEIFVNEGFRFDKGNVTAAVNGNNAGVTYYSEGDTKYYVEYTFAPCFNGEILTSVYVNNIVPPVPGENPKFECTVAGDGYEVGEVLWVDMTKESFLEPEDIFESGVIYRAYFSVSVTDFEKYKFSSQINVYVDYEEAVTDILGDKYVVFWYEFSPCAFSSIISDIEITNVVPPIPGETPVYNASVSEECTIQNISLKGQSLNDFMSSSFCLSADTRKELLRSVSDFSVSNPLPSNHTSSLHSFIKSW